MCGNKAARPVLEEGPSVVGRCTGCGMVYLSNPPPDAALAEEHAWEGSMDREKRARRRDEPVLHWLHDRLKPVKRRVRVDRLSRLVAAYGFDGRVLDLGCGTGHRSVKKLPPTAVPFGIELEPGPCRKAAEAFAARGGVAHCAPVLEGLNRFDDGSIDAALAYAYLEHETRPGPVLRALSRVLVPDAPLIIKVPNYASVNRHLRGRRWCGYRLPDHVNYFTPRTLGMLLETSGFRVVRSGLFDHLPTSDNLWMVARREPA